MLEKPISIVRWMWRYLKSAGMELMMIEMEK